MYRIGLGVKTDYKEAVKWYRPAAEAGDPEAQSGLGLMYEKGGGVAQDYAEALRLYRLAAEAGDAAAQYYLGDMYRNTLSTARNQKMDAIHNLMATRINRIRHHQSQPCRNNSTACKMKSCHV